MRLIIPGADFSVNAIGSEKLYSLSQGFATALSNGTGVDVNVTQANRVMTSQLYGSYTIKTNTGYVIRAIATYDTPITITGTAVYPNTNAASEQNVQGLTEYTLNNPGRYSIVTLCKTDATQNLSPTEDIVAELY